MAFLVDLKPISLKKLLERLERERKIVNKKVNKEIQKNPVERNKFQID